MVKLLLVVFSCVALCCGTPDEAAKVVVEQILKHDNFFLWNYGPAIINDALWKYYEQYKLLVPAMLNNVLDRFENQEGNVAYNALHDIQMKFDPEVGDRIGLFPIAYLARNAYYHSVKTNVTYSNKTDIAVALTIAEEYVAKFPLRLKDNTFSRHGGWANEQDKNASFVWCDDMFMGMALLARLSILLNRRDLLDAVAFMQLTAADHLMDPEDGLFHHGYNAADDKRSCCKWGRANGWVMMGHVEILSALKHFNDTEMTEKVLHVFQTHAKGVAKFQKPSDGRWHQLINETETFLETSATAMFAHSFIIGVENGWLPKSEYNEVIEATWVGLNKTIAANGEVSGICVGTGIGTSVAFYEQRPTTYNASDPGLGSVLYAVLDLARYK